MKRRELLQSGALVMLLGSQQLARGATILAVRVWPAPDYSRVTIESDTALKVSQFFVASPPRLAVDIEGIDLNRALKELVGKVSANDPTIAGVRVGQGQPGVVRLVLDLKQSVQPQVFTLPPVAAYRHRLVFDLYPTQVSDPLEALIAERLRDSAAKPPVAASSGRAEAQAATDPLGELITQKTQAPGTMVSGSTATSAPVQPEFATQSIASRAGSTGARGLNGINFSKPKGRQAGGP